MECGSTAPRPMESGRSITPRPVATRTIYDGKLIRRAIKDYGWAHVASHSREHKSLPCQSQNVKHTVQIFMTYFMLCTFKTTIIMTSFRSKTLSWLFQTINNNSFSVVLSWYWKAHTFTVSRYALSIDIFLISSPFLCKCVHIFFLQYCS